MLVIVQPLCKEAAPIIKNMQNSFLYQSSVHLLIMSQKYNETHEKAVIIIIIIIIINCLSGFRRFPFTIT